MKTKLVLLAFLAACITACVTKGPQAPRPNAAGPKCGISTVPSAPECNP